ncbi:heme exporter protein CcmD [Novosphingobium sp.]|nr:heme exporter protein CcmD [Novosphingobium sp.]
MVEGLNHWPFVLTAYGLTFAVTCGLAAWAWLSMRKAEARRERGRER